jgi:hypothetical protein
MKQRNEAVHDLYIEQAAVNELSPEAYRRLKELPGFSRQQFDTAVEQTRISNSDFHRRIDSRNMLDSIRQRAFSDKLDESRIAGAVLDTPSAGSSSGADASAGAAGRTGRQADRTPGRRRVFSFPAALAAALPLFLAAALIIRFPGIIPGISPDSSTAAVQPAGNGPAESGIRTKGLEPRIFIYRDAGSGQVELLSDGDNARAGDRLQLSYLSTGVNYGVIFSVDGSSVITLHYPENSDMLPRLQPRDEVYLSYGYRLDNAPDFERFFFVTSDEAFDVEQLLASVEPQLRGSGWKRNGSLDLPSHFSVHRIDLIK